MKKKDLIQFEIYSPISGTKNFSGYFSYQGVLVYVHRKDDEYFLTHHQCQKRCRQIARKMGIELPELKGANNGRSSMP